MKFLINTLLSALLISAAVEASKRSNFLAALLISLPLNSVLGLSILYFESRDPSRVAALSTGIFWMIVPSLGFLLLLPYLLRAGINFWIAMPVSLVTLIAGYPIYAWALRRVGIQL